MSIADQITRLNNAKAAIKQSIINKGVSVSDTDLLDDYASKIDAIEVGSGGSGDSEYMNPGFYELKTAGGTSYRGLFCYSNVLNLDVSSFGLDSSNVTDMSYMFYNCGQQIGTITGLHSLDFSKVKYINHMFASCSNGGAIDLSGISFPETTDAQYMFNGITYITSIDLSNTDFPKLKNLTSMFYIYNSCLTSINLTGTNMPNITNTNNMFSGCSKITSLDLSGINFSNVTDIGSMFSGCKLLVEVIGEIDCSKMTNGLYISYSNPFKQCNALETLYLKNIYKDVTNMNNASKWSINLSETVVKDECLVYIINELPDLINDKGLTATDKIVLTLPPTNTLTAEQVQVAIDKGWQVANTTY